jgi:hypothetical protein
LRLRWEVAGVEPDERTEGNSKREEDEGVGIRRGGEERETKRWESDGVRD